MPIYPIAPLRGPHTCVASKAVDQGLAALMTGWSMV